MATTPSTAPDAAPSATGASPGLERTLKQRHLSMIAIGGVIGAGLFMGSGTIINSTGPAVMITFAVTGLLIVCVMRMIAEMAVANPGLGSFADYIRDALGPFHGFTASIMYWYFWVIVVGFEAVAGARAVQFWWPNAPIWLTGVILLGALTITNVISVGFYGEFEYWFAAVKVFTIIAFIVLGLLYIFGAWPNKSMDFSNLTAHGGFFPLGFGAVVVAIVTAVFSMMGAEISTLAAAESREKVRGVVRAANSTAIRVLLFFVGSMFVVVTILPYNDPAVGQSPYVAVMSKLGIPHTADIMNIVVLVAVLSCLNSGVFTASRMIYSAARRGEAPRQLTVLNHRGVPIRATLISCMVGFACVGATAFIAADTVFNFLLATCGAVVLYVYLLIVCSHIKKRFEFQRTQPEVLQVKMWLFPGLSIVCALSIVAILVAMVIDPSQRNNITFSIGVFALVALVYAIYRRQIAQGAPAWAAIVAEEKRREADQSA
ncbi:amino acid permease [Micrococcales bacterium 31B]|nr:amino acid permease [Micrococcales bacterium 31B]